MIERIKMLVIGKVAKSYSNLEAIMTEYHVTDKIITDKIRECQQKIRELQDIVLRQ